MHQLENCQARYRWNTWMGRTHTDGPDEFESTKFDCIKAWMSLNFSKIPLLTSELADLERQKKLMNTVVCDHSNSFIFDWIFFILAGNKKKHYISDRFEIQQDPTRDL